jgi:hypothetical protein
MQRHCHLLLPESDHDTFSYKLYSLRKDLCMDGGSLRSFQPLRRPVLKSLVCVLLCEENRLYTGHQFFRVCYYLVQVTISQASVQQMQLMSV